jgi:hypothetical protein
VIGSGSTLVRSCEIGAEHKGGAALAGCLAQLARVLAVLDANDAPPEIGAQVDEAINSLRTYLVPGPSEAASQQSF